MCIYFIGNMSVEMVTDDVEDSILHGDPNISLNLASGGTAEGGAPNVIGGMDNYVFDSIRAEKAPWSCGGYAIDRSFAVFLARAAVVSSLLGFTIVNLCLDPDCEETTLYFSVLSSLVTYFIADPSQQQHPRRYGHQKLNRLLKKSNNSGAAYKRTHGEQFKGEQQIQSRQQHIYIDGVPDELDGKGNLAVNACQSTFVTLEEQQSNISDWQTCCCQISRSAVFFLTQFALIFAVLLFCLYKLSWYPSCEDRTIYFPILAGLTAYLAPTPL